MPIDEEIIDAPPIRLPDAFGIEKARLELQLGRLNGTITGVEPDEIDARAFDAAESRLRQDSDIHSGADDVPTAGMFRTAREMFAAVPEVTEWAIAGLVPMGGIAELDGPAKRAGKTTLLAWAMRSVLDGTPFMGRATRRLPVVMLSEQPVASLRASLTGAGLVERDDLWILTWGDSSAAHGAT